MFIGSSCHPRSLVRQELSSHSKVGVWGFLPTTHPCLSPNPLLDCVTSLAFSAWNLALLTAVAILGVLGTALDTGGSHSLLPSVLLLTSRQTHSGSLEPWTRVLEVIWRPQVCGGWTETGRSIGRRELGSCHLCLSPGSSWGLLVFCCSAIPLLIPWVVGMAEGQSSGLLEGLFPVPKLQVSFFCLIICPPQHHICHHSVLQGYHGSRGGRWRGGPRGQFLGGKQLGNGSGVAINCPFLAGLSHLSRSSLAISPLPAGKRAHKATSLLCSRLATTDGRCRGLRTGTGCVGTWLAASKNGPELRRPTPSSWLTGPASGGVLSRRVSQYAGLPKASKVVRVGPSGQLPEVLWALGMEFKTSNMQGKRELSSSSTCFLEQK